MATHVKVIPVQELPDVNVLPLPKAHPFDRVPRAHHQPSGPWWLVGNCQTRSIGQFVSLIQRFPDTYLRKVLA